MECITTGVRSVPNRPGAVYKTITIRSASYTPRELAHCARVSLSPTILVYVVIEDDQLTLVFTSFGHARRFLKYSGQMPGLYAILPESD